MTGLTKKLIDQNGGNQVGDVDKQPEGYVKRPVSKKFLYRELTLDME
jgi:hypothetical protein